MAALLLLLVAGASFDLNVRGTGNVVTLENELPSVSGGLVGAEFEVGEVDCADGVPGGEAFDCDGGLVDNSDNLRFSPRLQLNH